MFLGDRQKIYKKEYHKMKYLEVTTTNDTRCKKIMAL